MKLFKDLVVIGLVISVLASMTSCFLLPGKETEHVHEASSEWSYNSQGHWHKCTGEGCTMVAGKETHKFDGGIVTKQPTKTEEGATTYTCTVCGYEKDQIIEKYTHVHSFSQTGQCSCGTSFVKQIFDNNGYKLNYNVYTPAYASKENKRPLIIFLHGAGERGSDNQSQLKNAILKAAKGGEWANAVIIAPQCPSSTGGNTNSDVNDPNKWVETNWDKGNYVQASVPESAPMKALAELIKEYASYDYVDSDRIYVVGLSMGGFGTRDLISRYPELFAAAVPICGGGPTDKIDVLKNIPIYTFHGSSDASVPYSGTKDMYDLIKAAGGDDIIFYTFNGMGHAIWDQSILFAGNGSAYPSLESWLFSQTKK